MCNSWPSLESGSWSINHRTLILGFGLYCLFHLSHAFCFIRFYSTGSNTRKFLFDYKSNIFILIQSVQTLENCIKGNRYPLTSHDIQSWIVDSSGLSPYFLLKVNTSFVSLEDMVLEETPCFWKSPSFIFKTKRDHACKIFAHALLIFTFNLMIKLTILRNLKVRWRRSVHWDQGISMKLGGEHSWPSFLWDQWLVGYSMGDYREVPD